MLVTTSPRTRFLLACLLIGWLTHGLHARSSGSDLTIHGVKPGMSRASVHKLVGPGESPKNIGRPDYNWGQIVYKGPGDRARVAWVCGSQVERAGKPLLNQGSTVQQCLAALGQPFKRKETVLGQKLFFYQGTLEVEFMQVDERKALASYLLWDTSLGPRPHVTPHTVRGLDPPPGR